MVVTDERNRDRANRRDVVELTQYDQAVTVAYYGEELHGGVPLSHFSRISPLNMDKQNKVVEKKYKILNNSPTKQATCAEAQKFSSSMKAAVEGTSSRGEVMSSAVLQAEEVQSNLRPEFPSFVKSLVRSHVASCFWMGLPVSFCKRHLPDKDTTIILEDESGKEYNTKFIACKTGLSAGWRQFSAVHKLQEGDAVVFQLVEPTKFKVYIIRANNTRELDGAFLNFDSCTKQQKMGGKDNMDTDLTCNSSKRKHGKSVPLDIQKKKKANLSRLRPKVMPSVEQPEDGSEEALSEVMEEFRMLEFEDVRGFENFSIIVDGVSIDAEFPDDVRNKYYRLCCSQHAFLHENLIKGMNYKLVAGIISETVNIADAIKVSMLCTPRFEFVNWDKTLLAFEHLGMNVEFLRIRLRRLVSIAYEENDVSEVKKYLASRNEYSRADDEIRNIEEKLEELKGACNGFGAYIGSLKGKAENYHNKFRREVHAPW
ncbi:B3 domain-containing protein [Vigna angularis]|uniref:B3 domain-containing protein n=2 Tax=Phaseolus angularis TaxID=3914 RepID=A0A8T0L9A0_PHAAN|nr:B3 domain-containing protein Os01g0234100 [Vigna angularis]KAG2408629.1 B3 domain-containing protein [Vigna angularis]BAT75578.1 hypothetical protein VIGAN_01346000 [Vigna angularis var. angularis]